MTLSSSVIERSEINEMTARLDGMATMAEVHQLREQVLRDQERIAILEQQIYELAQRFPNIFIDEDLL